MWSKICQIIPNLARLSDASRLLADLDVLLCSGLSSRHRSIVNSSIRLWNSTFGTSEVHFVYPVNVKDALLSIHRVTEIQLPFFPESLQSDGVVDQRQLPTFAKTQSDLSNILGSVDISSILKEPATRFNKISPSSSAKFLKSYTPQVLIETAQSVPQKRSRESTPDSNNRMSRQRNVAPKLRHDDSQVQFEAIDSSPISNTVLDSQLLTDRQKEVKERQQAEAAMFPDLRSSPRQRERSRAGSEVDLPLHRSASKPQGDSSPARERETTPSLAPHVEFDEFVNSSPTPTRSLHNDGNFPEPPSSPPEAPEQQTAAYGEDDMIIASSPPEIPPDDVETDPATSLGPSAQVAGADLPTLSTFETDSNQQDGPSTNAIPSSARAKLDLRSEDPAILDELAALATTAVERALERENRASRNARLTAKIKELGARPGGKLPDNSPLLQTIRSVDAYLNIRSRIGCASTDANVPLSMGLPAISIGAGGDAGQPGSAYLLPQMGGVGRLDPELDQPRAVLDQALHPGGAVHHRVGARRQAQASTLVQGPLMQAGAGRTPA